MLASPGPFTTQPMIETVKGVNKSSRDFSSFFTVFQYGKPDLVLENEKKEFAKFAINNFHGNYLREFGPAEDYFIYQAITDPPTQFKQHKVATNWIEYQELDDNEAPLDRVFISGKSLK